MIGSPDGGTRGVVDGQGELQYFLLLSTIYFLYSINSIYNRYKFTLTISEEKIFYCLLGLVQT